MAKRTTHRSSSGKKLYAVRDSKGRFVDIQSYQRAHAADLRKKSKKEAAKSAAKGAAKSAVKSAAKSAVKAKSKAKPKPKPKKK